VPNQERKKFKTNNSKKSRFNNNYKSRMDKILISGNSPIDTEFGELAVDKSIESFNFVTAFALPAIVR
jgi:hypothetical protein